MPSALLPMPKHQTARSGGGPAKDAASGGVSDNRGASDLPAPRVGGARQVSDRGVQGVHARQTLPGNARHSYNCTDLAPLSSAAFPHQTEAPITRLMMSICCCSARVETDKSFVSYYSMLWVCFYDAHNKAHTHKQGLNPRRPPRAHVKFWSLPSSPPGLSSLHHSLALSSFLRLLSFSLHFPSSAKVQECIKTSQDAQHGWDQHFLDRIYPLGTRSFFPL